MAKKKSYLVLSYRQRRLVTLVAAVVLAGLIAADRSGCRPSAPPANRDASRAAPGSDRQQYDDRIFKVLKIVDGDTLDIDAPDGDKPATRIRLWGVDTPEVAGPNTKQMYFGPQASEFTKQLLAGQEVRIALEPFKETRGRYGRLLAYVYLPDGSMLNERLIVGGYGYADPRFRHVYQDRFAELEKQARRAQRGLWAEATPDDYPGWLKRKLENDR